MSQMEPTTNREGMVISRKLIATSVENLGTMLMNVQARKRRKLRHF